MPVKGSEHTYINSILVTLHLPEFKKRVPTFHIVRHREKSTDRSELHLDPITGPNQQLRHRKLNRMDLRFFGNGNDHGGDSTGSKPCFEKWLYNIQVAGRNAETESLYEYMDFTSASLSR
jgi:hypothetical protein